jgi:hypothetical protein
MVVRLHILSCNTLDLEEKVDGSGAPVVQDVQLEFVSLGLQIVVDAGKDLDHAAIGVNPFLHK